MSLFDNLFGRKPAATPKVPTFTMWDDEVKSKVEVSAEQAHQEPRKPTASWPFPGREVMATPEVIEETQVEEVHQLVVNTDAIAAHFEEVAAERRAQKAYLKEVVQGAPEHGIEFVHVGKTTFAWRYHTVDEETGYVRNRRLIDISSAVCNPSDQYAKWHGSAIAAEKMLNDQFITIRIGEDYKSPRDAVRFMGLATLNDEEIVEFMKSIEFNVKVY